MNNVYRSLAGVEGVEEIGFDPEGDTFVIDYAGSPLTVEEVKDAIERSVVAKPLRRALGRCRDEEG